MVEHYGNEYKLELKKGDSGFIICLIVISKLEDNPDIEELRKMMKTVKLKKL